MDVVSNLVGNDLIFSALFCCILLARKWNRLPNEWVREWERRRDKDRHGHLHDDSNKKWHWLYTHLCVAHKSNQCARYHYLYIIAVTVAIAVNWLSINWSNIRYSDYEASVLYMDWLIVVATDQKKKNQLHRFFSLFTICPFHACIIEPNRNGFR